MLKNRLKYWRHINQMEQKEFAEFLGYSLSQYNRWERHKMEPGLESGWDIAKKLKIPIEELYEEAEEN